MSEENETDEYTQGYQDRMQVEAEHGQKALFAALAKAQAELRGVEKDGDNRHHGYKYTSAEAMMKASTVALGKHGLSFVCTEAAVRPANGNCDGMLRTVYVLLHADGGRLSMESETPIHCGKGRPFDKAVATAKTYDLAYTLRGALNIPRVDEADERDSHDDELIQAYAAEGEKLRKKAEKLYQGLWKPSQPFFDMAQVPRPKSKEGAAKFKQWIAWAAHPGTEYPDDLASRLVSLELAKKALAVWKKAELVDQTYEAHEFAQSVGVQWERPQKAADDAAFEASLGKGEGEA